ncbi:tRNA lysidine(34) synthetase TilS [Ferruginibacter yonginensis]|uniref:tRNA(Ile)-lysidine synthase n=1 Tax=Ferruginibacter yonginensis TaxID=1310416 RepID=A0ABV8QNL2_9BACT
MELIASFQQYIEQHQLFKKQDRLLLAVSGGLDSAVLCYLCHTLQYDITIAHCNFNLRGAESDADEAFVMKLAQQLHVPIFVKHFNTLAIAAQQKKSIETTARELRYQWFTELLQQSKLNDVTPLKYILTAHHANDNVETVVMQFFRGTGIDGLTGIAQKQPQLIRPLLFATRKELTQFAQDNNIAFVTDSSNASNDYTRNYFRNDIIPSIEKVYAAATNNVLHNIERMQDVAFIYHQFIQNVLNKICQPNGDAVHIAVNQLKAMKPLASIVYEMCKPYNFTAAQTIEVIKLLESDTGKYVLSSTHRILKNRNWLIIAPLQPATMAHHVIEEADKTVVFSNKKLLLQHIEPTNFEISNDKNIACVDAKNIVYPLLLRKWKQGDYFYPLGLPKQKKISRFLIDQKVSMIDKENVLVIESNKKIIWVVGHRIDDRFKVTGSTKYILKLHLVDC